MKIAIVTSEFNNDICAGLVAGCEERLRSNGGNEVTVEIMSVPGAFELPFAIKQLARKKKYDGFIALGCVIRGETDHYTYVCEGITYGLQKVSIEENIPIMFGVLMCATKKLAQSRSGHNENNKGAECADSLLKLLKAL